MRGMTTDLVETQALLRATTADLSLVDTAAGVLRSQALPVEARYAAWQAARDLVEQTGRWPLLVHEDWWAIDLTTPVEEIRQQAFRAETGETDPWSVFNFVWDEPIPAEEYLGYVQHRFPEAAQQLVDQMRAELGHAVREVDVDRWLYVRLQEDPDLQSQLQLAEHIGRRQWHEPPVARLALLPTGDGWMAPLWASYHGADDEPAALAACLLEWQATWDADLVAAYSTILHLSVARRPTDPEQAWRLAGQLKAVGGSLQMYQYELAFAVMQSDAWFLHDRP